MSKKTTLKNGVHIITEEVPGAKSAALGIWVKAGSRNENPSEHGLSHFIEHLQFKGTEKRSARTISETIEEVGGQINAFTTKEYTCYYCRVLGEHVGLASDLLVDMFFDSKYSSADIEKEKGVIIEEIRSVEDTPDDIVHDYFAEAIWGSHPLGRSVLGTAETVGRFDREMVLGYLQREYVAGHTIFSAAGNINHETIVQEVGPAFERCSVVSDRPAYELVCSQPETIINGRAGEQVQICLGMIGVSHRDTDIYAMAVLNGILGGGLSSRLFQEIREERGLAYSIYSYTESYSETGLLCIHAGTSPENVREVIRLCLEIITELRKDGVSPLELNRSKQQVRGELLLGMESTVNQMSRLGRTYLTYGRVVSANEMVDRIMEVTLEDTYSLCQKLFEPGRLGMAIVGPAKEKIDLAALSEEVGLV